MMFEWFSNPLVATSGAAIIWPVAAYALLVTLVLFIFRSTPGPIAPNDRQAFEEPGLVRKVWSKIWITAPVLLLTSIWILLFSFQPPHLVYLHSRSVPSVPNEAWNLADQREILKAKSDIELLQDFVIDVGILVDTVLTRAIANGLYGAASSPEKSAELLREAVVSTITLKAIQSAQRPSSEIKQNEYPQYRDLPRWIIESTEITLLQAVGDAVNVNDFRIVASDRHTDLGSVWESLPTYLQVSTQRFEQEAIKIYSVPEEEEVRVVGCLTPLEVDSGNASITCVLSGAPQRSSASLWLMDWHEQILASAQTSPYQGGISAVEIRFHLDRPMEGYTAYVSTSRNGRKTAVFVVGTSTQKPRKISVSLLTPDQRKEVWDARLKAFQPQNGAVAPFSYITVWKRWLIDHQIPYDSLEWRVEKCNTTSVRAKIDVIIDLCVDNERTLIYPYGLDRRLLPQAQKIGVNEQGTRTLQARGGAYAVTGPYSMNVLSLAPQSVTTGLASNGCPLLYQQYMRGAPWEGSVVDDITAPIGYRLRIAPHKTVTVLGVSLDVQNVWNDDYQSDTMRSLGLWTMLIDAVLHSYFDVYGCSEVAGTDNEISPFPIASLNEERFFREWRISWSFQMAALGLLFFGLATYRRH